MRIFLEIWLSKTSRLNIAAFWMNHKNTGTETSDDPTALTLPKITLPDNLHRFTLDTRTLQLCFLQP